MAFVNVDPPQPPGILTSRRAAAVLDFLEQCGGASEAALEMAFPGVDIPHCLRLLRHTGYVRRCFLPGHEPMFVAAANVPPDTTNFAGRVAVGWLAAWLVARKGAKVAAGTVEIDGQVYRLAYWPGDLPAGPAFVVSLDGTKTRRAVADRWIKLETVKKGE